VDYFFRENKIQLGEVDFRKKSKLNNKKIIQIKEFALDYLGRYFEIENILNKNIPFTNPIPDSNKISNHNSIEIAANHLRKEWKLGINPIPNIIEMLEERGIKLIEIDSVDEFDGFSTYVQNTPIIVINQNLDTVRKRFTTLHELAHLLLDFNSSLSEKELERYCHSFAGAFLLPEEALSRYLSKSRSKFAIEELIEIKEYFGISVQAIVYRLFNLDYIPDRSLKEFFINLRKNRLQDEKDWGSYKGEESSSRFERLVYMAVSEEIISLSMAAQLLNRDLESFRNSLKLIS
jgi:Zn-dependent peptidase ImmA (M78 family)